MSFLSGIWDKLRRWLGLATKSASGEDPTSFEELGSDASTFNKADAQGYTEADAQGYTEADAQGYTEADAQAQTGTAAQGFSEADAQGYTEADAQAQTGTAAQSFSEADAQAQTGTAQEAEPNNSGAAPPVPMPPSGSAPKSTASREVIFGIDFGTSYTSIALVDGNRLTVLKDNNGKTIFPSVVCFPEKDQCLVGWHARDKSAYYPTTTITSAKRLIGRRYDDRKIEPIIASMPVTLHAGPNGQVIADIHGVQLAMPQICEQIFRHAIENGEKASGLTVRKVVISVPVEYKEERAAIRRAAELAGLKVAAMVEEPISAAIGYGLGRQAGLVLIYDFGGGTFDCTLLEVSGGRFRILAKTGDAWLGGDDFDLALTEHAARTFWRLHKIDLHQRKVEWNRILGACEEAKRMLSTQNEVDLFIPELVHSQEGKLDLKIKLDRALLAQLCTPLVERSIETVSKCLEQAGVKSTDIKHVAMTGGVSWMPLVREQVEKFFQFTIPQAVDPQHAVVVGDAVYASFLTEQLKSQKSC